MVDGSSADEDLRTATDALVERVVAGETEPLNRLFRRARRRIMLLICSQMSGRLKRRMDPEDVLQEVYIEALRQLPNFEARKKGSFYRWLAALTVNKIRNLEQLVRAAKRDPYREARLPDSSTGRPGQEQRLAAEQTPPSQAVARWEIFERILKILNRLPPRDREIIFLRYLHGCSPGDIARFLGLNRELVYKIISRGIEKVKSAVGGL